MMINNQNSSDRPHAQFEAKSNRNGPLRNGESIAHVKCWKYFEQSNRIQNVQFTKLLDYEVEMRTKSISMSVVVCVSISSIHSSFVLRPSSLHLVWNNGQNRRQRRLGQQPSLDDRRRRFTVTAVRLYVQIGQSTWYRTTHMNRRRTTIWLN